MILLLVLDFRSKTSLHRTQSGLFDISVYNSNEQTQDFYYMIGELYDRSLRVVFTQFYLFLERLAASDRLARHYTQNIDCIKNHLSHLTPKIGLVLSREQRPKTIQLYGRLKDSFTSKLFDNVSVSLCSCCENNKMQRINKGKRLRNIGRLRS